MSEHDELKRLAYNIWDGDWWPSEKGGYFDVRSGDAGEDNDDGRLFDYLADCKPSVIHGLIEEVEQLKAENEALRREISEAPDLYPNAIRIKRDDPEYSKAWMEWADEQQAMKNDSSRYRWFRSNGGPICYQVDSGRLSLDDLDAEIDAAMSKDSTIER